MSRRSGASIKAIFVVGVAGLFVYGVYSYHELHTRLKSSLEKEERLKQQHDSLSAQLQVVYEHKSRLEKSLQSEKQSHQKTKDGYIAERAEIETRFLNDKDDLMNRLKAVNQEHSMLKSQHEDMQSEYAKVQEAHLKLEEDHQRVVAQHNQEYQQLKQERNNEVSILRDTIADVRRKHDEVVAKYNSLVQSEQLNKNQVDVAQGNILRLKEELAFAQNQLQQQQQQNYNQQQQLLQQEQAKQNLQQQLQQQNTAQQQNLQQQQQQQQQQLPQLLFNQDQQNVGAPEQHDPLGQEQPGMADLNMQPIRNQVRLVPEPAQNQPVPMQVKAPGDSLHPGYHEVKINDVNQQNDAGAQGLALIAKHGQGRHGDVVMPDDQHKDIVQQQVFAPVIDQKEEMDMGIQAGNDGNRGILLHQTGVTPEALQVQPMHVQANDVAGNDGNRGILLHQTGATPEALQVQPIHVQANDVQDLQAHDTVKKYVLTDKASEVLDKEYEDNDNGDGSDYGDDDDVDDDNGDNGGLDQNVDDYQVSESEDDDGDDLVAHAADSALMPPNPVDIPPNVVLVPPPHDANADLHSTAQEDQANISPNKVKFLNANAWFDQFPEAFAHGGQGNIKTAGKYVAPKTERLSPERLQTHDETLQVPPDHVHDYAQVAGVPDTVDVDNNGHTVHDIVAGDDDNDSDYNQNLQGKNGTNQVSQQQGHGQTTANSVTDERESYPDNDSETSKHTATGGALDQDYSVKYGGLDIQQEKHENLGAKPQEGFKAEEDPANQVVKDDSLKDKKVQANGKFANWQGPGPQALDAKEKIEAPDGIGDAAGKVNQIHLPNVNDDGDANYDGPEGKEGLGGALGQNLVEEGEEGQVERPGLNLPQFPNQNQENQVQQPRKDGARKNGQGEDDVYKDKEDEIDDKKDDQYNEDDDDDNADNQENDAA